MMGKKRLKGLYLLGAKRKPKSMEIHVQKCQKCHSGSLKNILYREPGELDKVYVQCQECGEFVASYVISPLGYFHNGKGFESFLRGINRSGEFMSGRRIQGLFDKRKEEELGRFVKLIELLKKHKK